MPDALRLHPLLIPLLCYCSGIAAAGSFGVYLPAGLLPPLILLPILLRLLSATVPLTLSLSPLLFLCGNLLLAPLITGGQQERFVLDNFSDHRLSVEGVIVRRPEHRGNESRLLLEIEHIGKGKDGGNIPVTGLLQLRIGNGRTGLMTGDRVRFYGKLRPPRNYRLPGEFDAERAYALKRIVATSFVKNNTDVELTGRSDRLAFQRHFDITAAEIGRFITARLPGIEGGIVKALLLGDVADIPQEVKDAYSRTGVNHILSISGFHVGMIALALMQLWRALAGLIPSALLFVNFRRAALALSLPLIVYYLFLSGAAPATSRSVIMILLLAFSLFLEREINPVNMIILAAFALLLANPASLYDISFQLSFVAIWGLTVITPLLTSPLPMEKSGWLYKTAQFAAASMAAVFATLLPVAYYFQQTSLTGIISNFLIVPLLGYGAVVCGFSAIPFIWFAPVPAGWLLETAGLMTAVANRAIAFFDRLPLLPPFIPSEAEIVIFLAAMVLVTVVKAERIRYQLLAAASFGLMAMHFFPAGEPGFRMKMDFFSVGQGESTLITFRDGRTMLIDGGGSTFDSSSDTGRRLLLPALRKMGVKRIDYLVLSHSHPDHLQGLMAVAASLPVGEFWETGRNTGESYRQLRRQLDYRRVPTRILDSTSAPLTVSGVSIRTLHPEPADKEPLFFDDDLNEDSLVLRFDAGRFSALFAGDIGAATEFRLLDRQVKLAATLLKVPHHGSRYSVLPPFFNAVSPQIAIISAGYGNSFGLPSPEAITVLKNIGADIYRTDRDGTVTAYFPDNGDSAPVSVYDGQIH